jgi:DNA polymerase III delta prime subunit
VVRGGARSPTDRRSRFFVGRDADLARLERLLGDGAWLITITGPPGVGKTQLALHHADRLLDRDADAEVCFCDLTSTEAEAVSLLLARGRLARRGPEPSDEDLALAADIVCRLDRLPLAIELAAARLAVLSLAELQERLAQRFALLRDARREAPDRQRTLRAALDWSWDLLRGGERSALIQSSVFSGGFTLVAAEAVIDASGVDAASAVIDLIGARSRWAMSPCASRRARRLCAWSPVCSCAAAHRRTSPAAPLHQLSCIDGVPGVPRRSKSSASASRAAKNHDGRSRPLERDHARRAWNVPALP